MKTNSFKKIAVAGFVLLAVPMSLLAQKEKEPKEKAKTEVEQIIITRRGAEDQKTVIEINGNQVKVNGKDVKDMKDGDVTVRRNKLRDFNALSRARVRNGQDFDFNFDFDDDHISLFSEDENRAMLGVMTNDEDKGAGITAITKGSAAEKAGLQKGDIITRIGNEKIEDADDVSAAIKSHKPGDKVTVTVLRNGKEEKVTAELDKWKGVRIGALAGPNRLMNPEVWAPATPPVPGQPFGGTIIYGGGQPRLGLSIQDSEDGKGVKVLNVTEESNAAKAGIKKDDVITHVDGEAVNSADEISRMMRDSRDKTTVTMKVLRGGKTQNIEVRIPRKLKTTNL